MKRRDGQTRESQLGMTLIEVTISLALAIVVLGFVLKTVTQVTHLDIATEEQLAAFFFCRSVLEELHKEDFHQLAATGSGFTPHENRYVRTRSNVIFHTRSIPEPIDVHAEEEVSLIYGSMGGVSNCHASVTLKWTSKGGPQERTASTLLYANCIQN